MNEQWKPIIINRHETPYDISDLGRVRRRRDGRIKAANIIAGYRHVGLYQGGIHFQRRIAPLVMKAFGPPKPSRRHQIEHDNQNKQDDRAVNLIWATQSQNILKSYAAGKRRRSRGGAKYMSVAAYDLIKALWNTGKYSQVRIAAAVGLTNGSISRIVNDVWSPKPWAVGMLIVDYNILNAPVRKADCSKSTKCTKAQINQVLRWRGKRSSYWIGRRLGISRSYVHALWSGAYRRT